MARGTTTRWVLALALVLSACASDAPAALGEPIIFADQLKATAQAEAAESSEAAAPQPEPPTTAIVTPEPLETPAPTSTVAPIDVPAGATADEPTSTPKPTAVPAETPARTPGLLPCADATAILDLWLQSPQEPILREAKRFPTDLWICDDLALVSDELVCLPLKTARMYTMYADIYGGEFEELLTSNTIYCIAGDLVRLDPTYE